MQKLRSGTKYTIWILILSFGILWVLQDTGAFDAVMAGPAAMGEVKGQSISWTEYSQRLSLYTDQHRQQTGQAPDMEMTAYYEEAVWDELVLSKILQHKMNEMGLMVTDEEVAEMVLGDDPAPFIRQFFQREDGSIDRTALRSAIEAPELSEEWIQIEQQLREQRRQEKLSKFLESSLYVSDFEIEREFRRQNTRADFDWVRFPYTEVDDAEIDISNSEIRSYYRNNSDRFKRNRTWRFSYVEFSKAPTTQDSSRTLNELEALRSEFQATENDSLFLQDQASQTRYFSDFLNPPEVRNEHLVVFGLEVGEVSDPFIYEERAHMVKKLDERSAGETFTRARQIVLNFTGEDRTDIEELASDIAQQARNGVPFQQLAQMYSHDALTARRGGETGYFARQDKPEAVAEAAFQTSPGEITDPVEAENSFYILQILDRTDQAVRLADLSRNVEADPLATVEAMSREADDFSFYAREDGFESEAQRAGLEIHEALATEGNPFISGLGQSRVILNELKTLRSGRVSDYIETDESFIVLRVDEVIPEGVRPLEEVRPQIESILRDKKRNEILVRQINEELERFGSLEELAESRGAGIQTAESVRMNAFSLPNAGREPRVIGAVFGLDPGEVSGAIPGENAVFVVRLEERREADPSLLTSAERERIREELNRRKSSDFSDIWVDRIKADVDIKDFRHLRQIQQ